MAGGTAHERFIDLDGAVNARDLGGLEVAGGGRTASGVLLRADNLQDLSERDVARLVGELGLRVVIDLRTREEVALEGPGPLARDDRVDIRHRSLFPEAGEHTDVAVDAILPWRGRPRRGGPGAAGGAGPAGWGASGRDGRGALVPRLPARPAGLDRRRAARRGVRRRRGGGALGRRQGPDGRRVRARAGRGWGAAGGDRRRLRRDRRAPRAAAGAAALVADVRRGPRGPPGRVASPAAGDDGPRPRA